MADITSRRSARDKAWFGFVLLLSLIACRSAEPSPSPTVATETPTPASTAVLRHDPLLMQEGSPAIWLLDSGTIRIIRDWASFLAYGFRLEDVTYVSQEELAEYPHGAPLTRWVTGHSDTTLYVLLNGRRHPITDRAVLVASGINPTDITQIPDTLLERLPLATSEFDPVFDGDRLPAVTAGVWWHNSLWVADVSGRVRRWRDGQWLPDNYALPGGDVICSLAASKDYLAAGTEDGSIWSLGTDGRWQELVTGEGGWISALVFDAEGALWAADTSHYDWTSNRYQAGRGLIRISQDGQELDEISAPSAGGANDPLRSITALAWDRKHHSLWAGTRFDGLYCYDVDAHEWRAYTASNGYLAGNTVIALYLGLEGNLWVAADGGIAKLSGNTFSTPTGPGNMLSITSSEGRVWASGTNTISQSGDQQTWQTESPFASPTFIDRFAVVVLDAAGLPWFAGARHLIHFDGQGWQVYDSVTGATSNAAPLATATPAFPSPWLDYAGWLQSWPRPVRDNGRCIHYLQGTYGDEFELRLEIARLQKLKVRWVLVNYTDRAQLLVMAPLFRKAGIMAVWRPYIRPYQKYEFWAEDVAFLLSQGVAPYIQVYNEPSIEQEWDGKPVDQALYQANLLPALQEVVNAGGLAGLQHINLDWLRADLRQIKAAGMDDVLEQLFFVPHPYAANHPPEYDQDIIGVLGFREYARVLNEELGFVPPMIAGEGGWRLGDASDTRYPAIDEALHRDYYVALFDWFRTGTLSNGEPLPDSLFAFCPWLLSDSTDPAAWFDSASGDRTWTIHGVENMPDFVRRFSWD